MVKRLPILIVIGTTITLLGTALEIDRCQDLTTGYRQFVNCGTFKKEKAEVIVKEVSNKQNVFMKIDVPKGGARDGAGRPRKQSEKKRSYNVSLQPVQRDHLVEKYGTLTNAIKQILPTSLR